MNALNSVEIKILDFLHENLSCAFLDTVMPYITYLCEWGLLSIVLAVVFMAIPKTRKLGFTLALSILIGYLLVNLTLKPLVGRIRPYKFKELTDLLVKQQRGRSFPSGHTIVAFETAMSIFLYNRKWGKVCFAIAVAVGFSRLYLYMHYPTDVIAGAVLGILVSFASYKLIKKV